jgi:hypothetical protein
MVSRSVRGLLLAGVATAVVLTGSTETRAQGLFERLFGGCGWWGTPQTTCYTPWSVSYGPASCTTCPTSCSPDACSTCPTSCPTGVTAYSPVCDPCSVQTSYYTPETRRRWRIVREPVVSYRPAITQDPCSGCPVTSYSPVTRYRWRLRLVPYTTYRPAVGGPFSAVGYYGSPSVCNPCDPCAGGACAGGACGPTSYSGGSSCATGDCGGERTYNGGAGAADLQGTPPQTFQQNGQPAQERSLKPVPKAEEPEPRLLQPESNTTSHPVVQTGEVRLVSLPSASRAAPLEYNGWRPARD